MNIFEKLKKEKLYRSKERKIAGVCGGIAKYFGIDPTIVRMLFFILVLFNGAGLLLYIAGWIIMPEEPATGPDDKKPKRNK